MKSTIKMLKAALVGFFLTMTVGVMGQSTPPATQNPPGPIIPLGPQDTDIVGTASRNTLFAPETPALDFANELRNAILFYNPSTGSGLTLVASEREDHEDDRDLPFTSYRWFYMGQDPASATADVSTAIEFALGGTTVPELGLEQFVATPPVHGAHKLPVLNLTEGFHVFKVQGILNPDGASPEELCEVETETIVVYVLPRLSVAAGGIATGDLFQYCESDAAPVDGQDRVTLNATITFTEAPDFTPDVDLFEKRFRWYAVKAEAGTEDFTDIETPSVLPTSLDDVFLLHEAVGLTVPDFAPQMDTYGKYRVFLEVEYTIKDRQYASLDAGDVRVRPHVIYRDFVRNDDDNILIITVTPQPGKPHITIEAVID